MKVEERCFDMSMGIEQMYHLGILLTSSPLNDESIEDMMESEIVGLPWWKEDVIEDLDVDSQDLFDILCSRGRDVDGLVIQVGLAKRDNFRFDDDGNFVSCSVHEGYRVLQFVFGKTFQEAMDRAFKWAESMIEQWKREAKEVRS